MRRVRSRASRYSVAVLSVALATVVREVLWPAEDLAVPFMLFFPAVTLSAWFGGFGPGGVATALSALSAWYFLLDPRPGLARPDLAAAVHLSLFVAVGLLMSWLFDENRRAVVRSERQREQLRSTLASIYDGVIAVDLEGRVTFLNAVAEELTGWTDDDAAFRPIDAVFHVVDEATGQRPASSVLGVLRERTPVRPSGTMILTSRDGTKQTAIEKSAAPIEDVHGDVKGAILVFRDVSARRWAQARVAVQTAASAAIARSRTLQEAGPGVLRAVCECLAWQAGGFFRVDADGTALEGVWTWTRDPVRAAAYVAATEGRRFDRGAGLPGRVWESAAPLWVRDVTVEGNFPRAEAAARSGLRGAFAFPVVLRDEVLGVMEFFSDAVEDPDTELLATMDAVGKQLGQFIERTRAEDAARDSRALRLAAADVALDCIITADQDGRILETNPAAERVFGHPREALVGQLLEQTIVPPHLRAAHREGLQRYRDTGVANVVGRRLELSGLRADGTVFPLELAIAESSVGGRRVFIAYLRDITERRRAEEALAAKARELMRSNADLQQFAYVASHDLQEPLRMVSGFMDLLSRRYQGKLDPKATEWIAFAVDGAKRMQRLIQELLQYSRLETAGSPLVPLETARALDDAIANLRGSIAETAAEITSGPLPDVVADRSQLVQLFQNLLGNAIKFRSGEPPRVRVAAEVADGEAVFSVTDNGIGIEPRDSERIFLIFQRLHRGPQYPGTGLGLAICKRIVERHGGRIWVESTPGLGATFRFTLPRPQASAPLRDAV